MDKLKTERDYIDMIIDELMEGDTIECESKSTKNLLPIPRKVSKKRRVKGRFNT